MVVMGKEDYRIKTKQGFQIQRKKKSQKVEYTAIKLERRRCTVIT